MASHDISAQTLPERDLRPKDMLESISSMAGFYLRKSDTYTKTYSQRRGFSRREIRNLEDLLQGSRSFVQEMVGESEEVKNRAKERFQQLSKILPSQTTAKLEFFIHLCSSAQSTGTSHRPRNRRVKEADTSAYEDELPTQTKCLLNITGEVLDILEVRGINCVLFGGLACNLYGTNRVTNDIDILTFPKPSLTAEDIKKLIAEAKPDRFYLKSSRKPGASHKILQCILNEQEKKDLPSFNTSCKIDILTPGGKLNLPHIKYERIMYIDTYPVIPFPVLLLQKLQAWDDRRKKEGYKQQYQKRLLDLQDLYSLLRIGEYVIGLQSSKPWQDRELFSEDFEQISKRRVRQLCELYPEFAGRFRSVDLLI